jgi:hypothetical protein
VRAGGIETSRDGGTAGLTGGVHKCLRYDASIPRLSTEVTSRGQDLPRGEIANRSALLRELETDTAGLVEDVTDMDDLAIQFDGTDAGKRIIGAWKRARIIVDSGGGHAEGGTPRPPPPQPPH